MKYYFLIFILYFIFPSSPKGQEIITDVSHYPYIDNKPLNTKDKNIVLPLPFFDDFSYSSSYPDQSLWDKNDVYVNTQFPVNPPSVGVATLDAIDNNGNIHTWLDESSRPSDTLTSLPIDLSSADKETTYLSFFYQPQGRALHTLSPSDSLILNVIAGGKIYHIWYTNGSDYESFVNDTLGIERDDPDTLEFKYVHIKLSNPEFFTNDFRIQFVNYVSLFSKYSGTGWTNTDYWHIDYIYLNDNRSNSDTVFPDLALVEPPSLFMKNYSAMPWDHYESGINKELTDITYHVRNNDSRYRNIVKTDINIINQQTGEIYDFHPGQKTMPPFRNNSQLSWAFNTPPFEWYNADSTSFMVEVNIFTDDADYKPNNTASRLCSFNNYYAYDDGSAEQAYGIDPQNGATGRVAYKYTSYKGDTLRAVQFCFIKPKNDYDALQTFSICAWSVYDNEPGELIFKETGKHPIFVDGQNIFVTYVLDTAVYIDGDFFIGWEQNSNLLLNVGLDMNSLRTEHLYYFINSQWWTSISRGSLMIRPVFSEKNSLKTEIEQQLTTTNSDILNFKITPNPACENIFINTDNNNLNSAIVSIYNTSGQKVIQQRWLNGTPVNISSLSTGIYIISLENGINTPVRKKLLIRR